MDSLTSSFKAYSSCKHFIREDMTEKNPKSSAADIELGVFGQSSYDFHGNSKEGGFSFQPTTPPPTQTLMATADAPTQLIERFLHQQRASGEYSLDMDLDMIESTRSTSAGKAVAAGNFTPVIEQPFSISNSSSVSLQESREATVSFVEVVNPPPKPRQRPNRTRVHDEDDSLSENEDVATVLKCPSSFRRQSTLLRTKTKSRLMEPARQNIVESDSGPSRQQKSGTTEPRKSTISKSGIRTGGGGGENDEDEDPFGLDDLPDEYKKGNYSILTILECCILFVIFTVFLLSLFIPGLAKIAFWGLNLWKWVLLVFVLISGRLVCGWAIKVVVFFIERNFLLRKRLLYFVYGLRNPVRNSLWLGLVLLAWRLMFDDKVEKETRSALTYVTRILFCLVVGPLIWLLKTLLVKVLASSFHVSAYFDRIQESLFNQYVIQTLSGPPVIEIEHNQEDKEKVMSEVRKLESAGAKISVDIKQGIGLVKSRIIGSGPVERTPRGSTSGGKESSSKLVDQGITIDDLHKLNQTNISAWNMKRMINIARHGVLRVTTLDETVRGAELEDDNSMQIQSEYEAKRAAKRIFSNVARPGAKHIYLVDLMSFLRDEEAVKAMDLFAGCKDAKKISKGALKSWMINAFRERKALALTLNDTKTAVNKLHQMVNVLISLVIFVIWLLILGIATTHFLVFISSQLLLVVFIFGNTCKTTFEAIIFLFVMHPFDVGDRCEVEGVQMVVEEMNIMTTIFLRYDNRKITYPNSILATKPISNFYRSPDMGDSIDFVIHVATPVDKISIMKERIKGYIESKQDHWYPNPCVVMLEVEDMNKLKMAVWLRHRMNHQDMGERFLRREKVVEEMVKVFRDLDIEYRMAPLDVNVRSMAQISSNRLPSTWATYTQI